MSTAISANTTATSNLPVQQAVAIEQAEHYAPPRNAQHLLRSVALFVDEAEGRNAHRAIEAAVFKRQLLGASLDKVLAGLHLLTGKG